MQRKNKLLLGIFLSCFIAVQPAHGYDRVVDDVVKGTDCAPTPEVKDMPYYHEQPAPRHRPCHRGQG
jgi:hypothetical protein